MRKWAFNDFAMITIKIIMTVILLVANDFAVSRTVSRYHWNSDIIQGRIIGSVMNPICRATSDYGVLFEEAKKER